MLLQKLMKTSDSKPLCPVNEPECRYLDELVDLRIENRSLSELIRTDNLTGLFNYRHFQEALDAEMERTRRTGLPTSLIMLDLDHFKQVNDQWGHENGNRVLRLTAEVILDSIRKIDIACRYGGEEFAVILPGTYLTKAIKVATRIRMALELSPLELDEGTIHFTASLGVNIYQAEERLSAEQFVHHTDLLLYQAKEQGRNRICHPEIESGKPTSEVSADEKAALTGKLS